MRQAVMSVMTEIVLQLLSDQLDDQKRKQRDRFLDRLEVREVMHFDEHL